MALFGPEWVEQRKRALGLDQPLAARYGLWLREVAQGNLGFSYVDRRPVADKIVERLWPTLKLMATAEALALAVALPVGVTAALRQYSKLDYLSTIGGFAAVSMPSFFLALGGIYLFAVKLEWLPAAGMTTHNRPPTLLDSLHHLVLPAAVLGLGQAAPLIRYVRSSMLETIQQDYVHVARAKGLREYTIVYRHALRNALLPLVTILALDLPHLLGGTVIIEQIFSLPGIGRYIFDAIANRDYPVVQGVTLVVAAIFVLVTLTVDILYAVLDPRLRTAR
jgi:peptide/nickel transport system permease protein